MRRLVVLSITVIVLAIVLILLSAQSWVGRVRVHDGDTVAMGKTSFRLWGINAPELHERGGVEARNALILMIGDSDVQCQSTGALSYKRVVAVCSSGRYADLGAELVMRGLVLDCPRYSGGYYARLEVPQARRLLPDKPYCRSMGR